MSGRGKAKPHLFWTSQPLFESQLPYVRGAEIRYYFQREK